MTNNRMLDKIDRNIQLSKFAIRTNDTIENEPNTHHKNQKLPNASLIIDFKNDKEVNSSISLCKIAGAKNRYATSNIKAQQKIGITS